MKQTIPLALGRPFAPFYSAIMRLREHLYHRNILPNERPAVPVISVGNLVLGGTGKTPMVRYLADFLQANGCNPAIISRGYKGAARQRVNIVANKEKLLLSAEEAGDEPFMLAASLPGTMVLTGRKRIEPAIRAVEMGADSIILDDGFQHLAIQRDIDIVLFDAGYQAGNSRILPAGPLREPVAALNRADCFVLTGTTEENEKRAEKFAELLTARFADIPVFFARRSAMAFTDNRQNHCAKPKEAALAFCGIARPENFRKSLEENGVIVRELISFADHAAYTPAAIYQIEKKAEKCGAEILVTTEKDSVKLRHLPFSMPLFIAGFTMTITEDFPAFLQKQPALSSLFHATGNNNLLKK